MAQKVHLIGRDGDTYRDDVELTQEFYMLPRVIVDGEYVFVREGDRDDAGKPLYIAVTAYWLRAES